MKGRRECDLKAVAANLSATVDERTSRTDYIREFENISGKDDVLVVADYYTWYEKKGDPGSHWYDDEGQRTHLLDPVLGEYASGDETAISKHIDWATGHGIDAFFVSWWSTGTDERTWDYHVAGNLEELLKDRLIDNIRFAILYENNGEFLAENYFGHPSYLRINDKPVVRFDYTIPFRSNMRGVFDQVRKAVQKKGFDVYLVNDLTGRTTPWSLADDSVGYGVDEAHFQEIAETFDAIGASNFPGAREDIDEDIHYVEKVYLAWRDYAKMHGKDFIPGVWPGHRELRRSPERLAGQIKLAKQYSSLKAFSIISFNEWEADHQVEPSKEEGFAYLESISDKLQRRH